MKRSINNKKPNKGGRPTKKLSEKRKYRITVKMATEEAVRKQAVLVEQARLKEQAESNKKAKPSPSRTSKSSQRITQIKNQNHEPMASIKVKFRPSTNENRAGIIYYQIIQNRVIRQLKTDYRPFMRE